MPARNKRDLKQRLERLREFVDPSEHNDLRKEPPLNENWYNHQCFIRHMGIYLTLCHAIKFADIGLLRQALREVCILFQAKEANASNYAPELLRLMHLYDSEAADLILQEAMLINGLVNLSGKPGKSFEIDRLVEFLNGMVALVRRDRISSTKPISELLREVTLSAPYMLELKQRLEAQFGKPRSGDHLPKDASEDIWIMALDLRRGDLEKIDTEQFSAWLATDLIYNGYQNLGENVLTYNSKIDSGLSVDDNTPDEGEHIPFTTQPYDSVHEMFETVLAP